MQKSFGAMDVSKTFLIRALSSRAETGVTVVKSKMEYTVAVVRPRLQAIDVQILLIQLAMVAMIAALLRINAKSGKGTVITMKIVWVI